MFQSALVMTIRIYLSIGSIVESCDTSTDAADVNVSAFTFDTNKGMICWVICHYKTLCGDLTRRLMCYI